MYVQQWKVQIRLERDGTRRVLTQALSKAGEVFTDIDVFENAAELTFNVNNHLASAEKVFEARLTAGLSK